MVVVLMLFVTAQLQIWVGGLEPRGGRPLFAALVAGFTLPLLMRRQPLAVLLVVVGCVVTQDWLGGGLGQPWFAVLVATYGLGSRGSALEGVAGMAGLGGMLLAFDLPRLAAGAPVDEVVPAWFIVAGAFGLGRWIRSRHRDVAVLHEHAAALERDREEATRAAVAHEQARIARELHDLVAHSLAVIVLQAQAGGRVVDRDVAQARTALDSIEHVGREGLTELRRLLDVLETAAPDADGSRPSLAHLDRLQAQVAGAGVPVDVEVEGTPRPLPPGLDLSAYRIVQEALTNTLKHAGRAARARVRVRYLGDALELEVSDDGHAAATTESRVGRGLIGMRERTALYGGTLDARRDPEGGFRVRAWFPVAAS